MRPMPSKLDNDYADDWCHQRSQESERWNIQKRGRLAVSDRPDLAALKESGTGLVEKCLCVLHFILLLSRYHASCSGSTSCPPGH
jgi:hypothetical protein